MSLQAPPVLVTQQAAARALYLAQRDQCPPVLRLGVQAGGCSGFSYVWKFESSPPSSTDVQWQVDGLTVVVSQKSLPLLQGACFDFNHHLLKGGFRFTNPLARSSCSCGESFTPDPNIFEAK